MVAQLRHLLCGSHSLLSQNLLLARVLPGLQAANAWVGEEISGAISPRLEINTQGFVCSLHALWTESQWYAPVSKIVHLCSSRFRCGVCCEYLRNSEDYSQWHVEALGRRYYTLLIRD